MKHSCVCFLPNLNTSTGAQDEAKLWSFLMWVYGGGEIRTAPMWKVEKFGPIVETSSFPA